VITEKVEFGFTQSSPGVYVYQDITAYVKSVSINRGLSRDTGTFQSGSADLVLLNNNREFDPNYSSSPFYGEVKPQASLRITSAGVVIFTGFIEVWDFQYNVSLESTVNVSATDATARLAAVNFNADTVFSAEMPFTRITTLLGASYVNWQGGTALDSGLYQMGAGTAFAGDSVWSYMQKIAESDGGTIFISGDNKVTFKSGASLDAPPSTTTYRYNLCKVPNFETVSTGWLGTRSTTVAYKGSYSLQSTSIASDWVNSELDPYGVQYSATTPAVTQNNPYTFSVWVRSATAQTVYLNAGFKKTTTIDLGSDSVTLAANTWSRLSVTVTPSLSAMTTYLSVSGTATFYVDAALIESGAVLNEFFDGTYKPTDTATVIYTSAWDGTSGASTSTLTIVTSYPANTDPFIVIGDNGGTAIPYTDIKTVYANEQMYNQTVVLRNDTGTGGTATNAANGTAYGVRNYTFVDSLVATDISATSLAGYYLGLWENPEFRFQSITMALHALSADHVASVLGVELWGGATVTYTPNGIGTGFTLTQRVFGITHDISPEAHNISLELGAFNTRFRLDSPIYGVLNQNILGY
jgi:hypothetical protein